MSYRQQSNENDWIFVISLVLLVLGIKYYSAISKADEVIVNTYDFFKTPNEIAYLLMIIGAVAFSISAISKTYQLIVLNLHEYKERKRERENQICCIENVLEQNLADLYTGEYLTLLIRNLRSQLELINSHAYLQLYKNKILNKIKKANYFSSPSQIQSHNLFLFCLFLLFSKPKLNYQKKLFYHGGYCKFSYYIFEKMS